MTETAVPTDEQKQEPLDAFKAQGNVAPAMINTWPHVSPCPSCGHCPTCGRSKVTYPWGPYPTGPFYVNGQSVPATAGQYPNVVFGGHYQ